MLANVVRTAALASDSVAPVPSLPGT